MGTETRCVPRKTETMYVLKVMRYLDCMGTQVAYVIDGVFEDCQSAVHAAERLPRRHEHNKFETGCWKIVRATIHLYSFRYFRSGRKRNSRNDIIYA